VNAKSRPTAKRRTGRQNRAGVAKASAAKKVLVVDVGGASVKILELESVKAPSLAHDSSTNNLIRRYRKLKELS
jgi:hypothetical protein